MRSPDHRSDDARSAAQSLLLDAPLHGAALETSRQSFPEIIGRSSSMRRVLETVSKVARSDSSVLILGESGTGKELIAAAIHRLSPRCTKPYVPLNCSAIPENLLESELFGHERGAFTGADRRRTGRFEAATGGSIFLDEIGDMPLSLQVKLLRVLQDKKFTLLGGNNFHDVDVRIVAATNMNLEQAVKSGAFRLDLYYRLNVLPVVIPPLRERSEDIPDLLEFFVAAANRVQAVSAPCFMTDELIQVLCGYSWPGNVRQLQNLVERLVVMKGGGHIGIEDLPREMLEQSAAPITPAPVAASVPATGGTDVFAAARGLMRAPGTLTLPRSGQDQSAQVPAAFGALPSQGLDLTRFIEDLENDLICQALERTGHNRNQAAKLLGLNRTTLVERIKKRRLVDLNEPSKEL